MRKSFLALALALWTAFFAGWAEEQDCLYPIRENGRWGYMNRAGETVIPPQWEDAEPFSGGAAIVTEDADGHVRLVDPRGCPIGGERYEGRWKETPYSYLLLQYSEAGREAWGWYDKQSGHLEPCRYTVVRDCVTDCGLILAQWTEESAGAEITAFLERDTGNIVLPVEPNGELYSAVGFSEGYAYLQIETEDGWTQDMIDASGRRVTLPDGFWPASPVYDGVMVIVEAGGNCGVARPDGTVVRMPEEIYIDPFSEGRAFFYPKDQAYDTAGIMDTEGRVIAEPTWTLDAGWSGSDGVRFHHGYAVLRTMGGPKVWDDVYVILDREGREVYAAPVYPDGDTVLILAGSVMENGLIWYRLKGDEARYGLLRIRGGHTEDLTGPAFSEIGGFHPIYTDQSLHFSEGLYPVMQEGQWGYIDETGQWVLPPVYDAAEHFRCGLAMTEADGKLQYIDHSGRVIWREK